jgi:hypothetical protein
MFVILGLAGNKPEITKSVEFINCPHCNNRQFWNLIHEQTNFSLFFLPLFSVKDKYFKACPICQYGQELTKTEYTFLLNKSI